MKLTKNFLRTVPKVLLHDHLDGGVRPQTVIDLARDQQYTKLPTTDAGELANGFSAEPSAEASRCSSKDLNTPAAVMKTRKRLSVLPTRRWKI